MKRILIGILAFFLLTSTTYAAVNGTYKGRPIVKVVVNGQTVNTTVPAQIIDGATLLPLRAIGDAIGADVKWDQSTYTATFTTPDKPVEAVKTGLSLEELNKIGESVGILFAYNQDKYVGQGSGFVVDDMLVTNWYVLEKATQFIVAFETEETTIQVKDALFKNESADLIGFKLEGYPGLKLSTEEPKQGSTVYSLGYPHRKFQISEGMFIATWVGRGYQTTANIEGGSSGGSLLNAEGKVIGVTASSVEENNWNYSIPAQVLQEELNKLK